MGLLFSSFLQEDGLSFIQTSPALRSNRIMGYLQVMRAMLAGACLYSPCRLVFCCTSAVLSAKLLLAFPCRLFSTSRGCYSYSAEEFEAFIFLHCSVNTAVSAGRRHAKGTPLFSLLLIPGLLLLALSSSCKHLASLKGDSVKFERKLESS